MQLEGDPFSEEDRHLRNAATAQAVVPDRERRRERTFALALEQPVVFEKTENARDVRPLPGVVPDSSNTSVRRRAASNGRGRRPVAMVTHATFLHDTKAAVAQTKYEEPEPVHAAYTADEIQDYDHTWDGDYDERDYVESVDATAFAYTKGKR